MPSNRIISLDCESNGLHGQVFSVGASVQHDGIEVETFVWRCPLSGPADLWVTENVLPQLEEVELTHPTYGEMAYGWSLWYAERSDHRVVCHIPWPVEALFLWHAHLSVPFSGPYPLIDVASMLEARGGQDPTQLDDWLLRNGHTPEGSPHHPHHPLFDARQAAAAYWLLTR